MRSLVWIVLLGMLVPTCLSAAPEPNGSARVWHVRNDAPNGGDGSLNSPFNLLLIAEAASAPGDTIFVHAGDGTATNQNTGIVLQDGQSLIGEGVPLVIGDVTVVPAGNVPVMTSLIGPGITLANGNSVRGVSIVETKEAGIAGNGPVSGLTLDRVTIRDPGAEAVLLPDASGAVTITASHFEGAPAALVEIGTASNLLLEVSESRFMRTAPPLGGDGLRLAAEGSGSIRLVARRNVFEGLYGEGIDVGDRGQEGDAFTLEAQIVENRFASPHDEGTNGISIKAGERGTFSVAITANELTGVSGLGAIALAADDFAVLRGRVASNVITGTPGSGIDIAADESAGVDLRLEDNTIRETGRHGIAATGFEGKARLDLVIRNNQLDTTGRDGVMLALYGGTMLATLSGNESAAPVGVGFLLANFSPGVFMLRGDPSRTAQENVQQMNTGSAGTAGTIAVVALRRRAAGT
ncbi:MAG TPA: right-handed parallel beta-helix repeat-containing protein [Thermoanaerobaculia bacterium]|nr:right-handed parallel beta-helix repeat-containing protein [Thermoanaerobaculia bacterium]